MAAGLENNINMQERQALIKALPCFSMLTPEESAELSKLTTEVKGKPNYVIVSEDELIDSVYIIAQGQAEVSRQATVRGKMTKIPVAVLGPGEAIGLNDTGFFSETGKRTATVTAFSDNNSDIVLIKLHLKDLHQFLHEHPHLQSAMYATAGQMLRIQLIKQSLPFNKLSYERLQKLANQVEEIKVPAGKIIFHQGEIGNSCYLIRSGQVEIIAMQEDGLEHRLAVLKSPTLFGEATLITRAPRNATARALENCELLVLRHEHLSELIESEENVAKMFMSLMVDRSRPLKNPDVAAHQRTTADGQRIVILKNSTNHRYFKLSEEGWFIWQQLDGHQTMQEITLALADKFNIFAPDVVAALISKLAHAGFVTQVEVSEDVVKESQPLWVRAALRVRNCLEARVAIGDADKWLTTLYKKGAHFLFTRLGQIILMILAVTGCVAFGFATEVSYETFIIMPDTWVVIVCLIPFTIISVALHELGHALTTKAFGYEVHYIGVGWYWLGPVAFTDTSDMWLSTRGPRTAVNVAGIYTDILVAGISALLIFVFSNPYIQLFLWLFALFSYVNAFRMLNPLQELDGYYILMDLLDRPRLRHSAIVWLVKDFPKSLRHPKLFREHRTEAFYWLACLVFLVLVGLVTLLLQTFVFKILGIHSGNPVVSLALPVLVALISSLGVIAEIRGQVEE